MVDPQPRNRNKFWGRLLILAFALLALIQIVPMLLRS
jgi:hypothetical protein